MNPFSMILIFFFNFNEPHGRLGCSLRGKLLSIVLQDVYKRTKAKEDGLVSEHELTQKAISQP